VIAFRGSQVATPSHDAEGSGALPDPRLAGATRSG